LILSITSQIDIVTLVASYSCGFGWLTRTTAYERRKALKSAY